MVSDKFKVGDEWQMGKAVFRILAVDRAHDVYSMVAMCVRGSDSAKFRPGDVEDFTGDGRFLNSERNGDRLERKVEPLWEGEIWVLGPGDEVVLGTASDAERHGDKWRKIRVRELAPDPDAPA